MKHQKQINALLVRAEKWALANPGKEYRRAVIEDDGQLSPVSIWFFEEACVMSEYRGEVFAIKEDGKSVYSSWEPRAYSA